MRPYGGAALCCASSPASKTGGLSSAVPPGLATAHISGGNATVVVENSEWLTLLASPFHPPLQNQHRRHPVNGLPALLDREIGFAQQPVGFGRSEPLVPEMHRQPKSLAQFFGKDLHLVGLNPFGPAHAQRQPDHNLPHVILLNHPLQVFKVVPLGSALQGLETLGRDPKGVRYGHADPAGAYVKAENPADGELAGVAILGTALASLLRIWLARNDVVGVNFHGLIICAELASQASVPPRRTAHTHCGLNGSRA